MLMYNPQTMGETKQMHLLAVDWGARRIGVAISDPAGKIARPLEIINHISRLKDAERIIKISDENSIDAIIIGVTYDDNNYLTPSGRSANKLGDEITRLFGKQVILWDEAFSTIDAKRLLIEKGTQRSRRKGHQDHIAAAILLQNYLDKINP
jgi:putative Holliday junction resolvase